MLPKFRGKRVDDGEWVYGDVSNNPLTHKSYIDSYDDVRSYVYEVVPESVCQYTGAKDKNGTDIYKGDIVRKEEGAPDDPAFGYYGSIGVVKYDPEVMGFVIDATDTGDDGFYDYMGVNFSFNEIEVIGNIYEDHPLIE